MGSYALIKKGKVTNTILWDGPDASPMEFDKGVTYVEIPDGEGNFPSAGWAYDGATFSAPELTKEEVAANEKAAIDANISLKQSLMDDAIKTITVWQTKLLMGRKLTDSESSSLNGWMDYIDSLQAIDAEIKGDVDWPALPS